MALSRADLVVGINDASVGIVLEVRYPRVTIPDYRTPTDVLVYFPDGKTEWGERWFHKKELKMVKR